MRLLSAALVAFALTACGGNGVGELSDSERSRVQALALDLAGSLGDPTPETGVAVATERRKAAEVLWHGAAVGGGEVIVVALRGGFSLYSSPPASEAETLPVLIVVYDRATMAQTDIVQRERFPPVDELTALGDVVELPM